MAPSPYLPTIIVDWPKHFDAWSAASKRPGPGAHDCLVAARKKVPTNNPSDWEWLAEALVDPSRKVYVAMVFKRPPVPKRLLSAFLRAAVHERNPSLNRVFIEPCVRSWGGVEVNRRLLQYLQEGTNEEKAGAASAFYWAGGNPRNEDLKSLRTLIRSAMLREFVGNEDVSVRQRILPLLGLEEAAHLAEDRPLVAAAVSLARGHADEYIRHRVEVQLGHDVGTFAALPTSGPR